MAKKTRASNLGYSGGVKPPERGSLPKTSVPSGSGVTLTRTNGVLKSSVGANYAGISNQSLRDDARKMSAGNKSIPYKMKASDTPSASGSKAFGKLSNKQIAKTQRKVKRAK